mmetsp:Transcript_11139/g.23526  ORF Transcript_11139/g.23526 Transcript_11139/m.23526 type:complete len:228 (+) Transcript_11139:211-894(+)
MVDQDHDQSSVVSATCDGNFPAAHGHGLYWNTRTNQIESNRIVLLGKNDLVDNVHDSVARLDVVRDNFGAHLVVVVDPILEGGALLANGACLLAVEHLDRLGAVQILESNRLVGNDVSLQNKVNVRLGQEGGGIVEGLVVGSKDGPHSVAEVVHEAAFGQQCTEHREAWIRAGKVGDCLAFLRFFFGFLIGHFFGFLQGTCFGRYGSNCNFLGNFSIGRFLGAGFGE